MNSKTKTPAGHGGRGNAIACVHPTKPPLEIQKDFLELIDLIYTVSDRLDVSFLRYKKAGAK